MPHAALLRHPFIGRRRQLAIPCEEPWWSRELVDMLIEAGHQFCRIIRVAVQPPRLGDDAALGLAQLEDAPELHWLTRLALSDDRRMGAQTG